MTALSPVVPHQLLFRFSDFIRGIENKPLGKHVTVSKEDEALALHNEYVLVRLNLVMPNPETLNFAASYEFLRAMLGQGPKLIRNKLHQLIFPISHLVVYCLVNRFHFT